MLRFQKHEFASLTTIFGNSYALILLFLPFLVTLYIHNFNIRCIINLLIYLCDDFFNIKLLRWLICTCIIRLPSPNFIMSLFASTVLIFILDLLSSIAVVDLIGCFAVVFDKGIAEENYNNCSLKQVVDGTDEKDWEAEEGYYDQ